jgi:hypothetical protein
VYAADDAHQAAVPTFSVHREAIVVGGVDVPEDETDGVVVLVAHVRGDAIVAPVRRLVRVPAVQVGIGA